MSLAPPETIGPLRRERLRTARLYLVCEALPRGEEPEPLLQAALTGGVDIVQLREKELDQDTIIRSARTFRRLCDTFSTLFIVNDDPDLARRCDADGVHLGQDDMPVAEARELLGPEAIIGLSTHSEEQIDAAASAPVDYISVGPIWETPTKEGRPGVGVGLVEYAAANSAHPVLRDRRDRRRERGRGRRRRAPPGSARCGRSATRSGRRRRPKRCERCRRVARRKRKERGAAPSTRERMEAGYARAEERNREAREALEPLAEGDRPRVVTVAAVICALIAISIVVGYLTGTKVNGSQTGVRPDPVPALLMGTMAWGMWRARYWAVLGFQMILVLLIFSAVFGLAAQAASLAQIAATLGLLAVAGTFFWLMVKAMARIQMPTRHPD